MYSLIGIKVAHGKNRDGWLYLDPNNMRFGSRNRKVLYQATKESQGGYTPWDGTITTHPPSVNSSETEVETSVYEYEDAPEGTFVVSGPLGTVESGVGFGPGRRFESIEDVERWLSDTYAWHRRIPDAEIGGRWAYRVRPRALHTSDPAAD